jgi:hypothetical protein
VHRSLPPLAAALAAVTASAVLPLLAGPAHAQPTRTATLQSRSVLPAQTFAAGPVSGTNIGAGPFNGVTVPFASQPVQGISALIEGGTPGTYLALSDNGYGSKANSADYLLRAYFLRPRPATGQVEVLGHISFSDPRGLAGQPLTRADRLLTGADFDPESIRRVADGTYWVGEEFGPALLHFSATGELLQAPVRFPVPERLAAYGRGLPLVTSPDAPELVGTSVQPNHPRSGGIEGMALSTDGRTLYPSLEAALLDDPLRQRRVVYAFDVATQRFLPQTADLMLSDGTAAIGDLTAAGKNSLLVIERDNGQGEAALAKRIALVDISNFSGTLPSTPLVDLLSLANPKGIGGPETSDTVGLGSPFGFPFVTIESLLVKNPRTLVVANDNNFPFSSGRRPGSPDDTEIIEIRLPRPLPRGK